MLTAARSGWANDDESADSVRAGPGRWQRESLRGAPGGLVVVPCGRLRKVDAPADDGRPPPARSPDLILVTAQRQETKLQETPVAIMVFDRGRIEDLGIFGVNDLTGRAPNTVTRAQQPRTRDGTYPVSRPL